MWRDWTRAWSFNFDKSKPIWDGVGTNYVGVCFAKRGRLRFSHARQDKSAAECTARRNKMQTLDLLKFVLFCGSKNAPHEYKGKRGFLGFTVANVSPPEWRLQKGPDIAHLSVIPLLPLLCDD